MTAKTRNIVLVSATTVTGTYKDLADFNFEVLRVRGPFSQRQATYPEAAMPGRLDGVLLSTRPTGRPREIIVEGTVLSSSTANLTTNIRDLSGWCARAVALQTIHDSSTFLEVKQVSCEVEVYDPVGKQKAARVTLTFRATKPLWYHTTASAVTFTSNTAMPLGTAPVGPVIRITGTLTNPTVTLKDSTGATVTTLGLTITQVGASDYVEIDCARQTIIRVVSAVESNAIATLTSGYFFELDPANADTVTPTWPSLSVAYGSGSGTAVSTFRRAYF